MLVKRPQRWTNITMTLANFVFSGDLFHVLGGGPRALVKASTPAFKCQLNKMSLSRSLVKIQYCGEPPWPRGRVLGLRRESFWKAVSSHSSHYPQEVLLAQFSLYVHKGGLKSHSFHFVPRIIKMNKSNVATTVIDSYYMSQ